MAWTRRQFVSATSALVASAAVPHALGQAAGATLPPAGARLPPGTPLYESLVPADLPTIRQAGASRGLLAGCAVSVPHLRTDTAYAALIRQQAGIVVAENAMKFASLHPTPTTFFFDDADFLFRFAEDNGMKVRGHNFVWHRQLPAWFKSDVNKTNAEAVLINHIQTVAHRYAGRVQSWDVVNEAIQITDGQPGGLRNSPWYQLLGPGYIDLAFRAAHAADPGALLCYNDYDLESEAPAQEAKRRAVLELVRGMQSRNVPIGAVGIQSHLHAGEAVYGNGLRDFMQAVQALGLKLMLTEMDVNDRALPAAPATRDAVVARVYQHYLDLTLANTDVVALLTWGLTDRYTWLNGEDARRDKLPERCLPFDADLRPVPAYVAEVEAIQAAPARPDPNAPVDA